MAASHDGVTAKMYWDGILKAEGILPPAPAVKRTNHFVGKSVALNPHFAGIGALIAFHTTAH